MPVSKEFLPALMPELVNMYNSGNSAVSISKIVYFGCLKYQSRKSSRPAVTSYKICFSVFEEA